MIVCRPDTEAHFKEALHEYGFHYSLSAWGRPGVVRRTLCISIYHHVVIEVGDIVMPIQNQT